MADDPILDAKTVEAMMAALNGVYHLKLPTSFPDGTVLAQLWEQAIEVTKGPGGGLLYVANGTTQVPITVLPGTVNVSVVDVDGALSLLRGEDVPQP